MIEKRNSSYFENHIGFIRDKSSYDDQENCGEEARLKPPFGNKRCKIRGLLIKLDVEAMLVIKFENT